MKTNKQVKNWWIDVVLMVGCLFCFYLDLTGIAAHEWLGGGLTILTIVHFWLHRDWVKAVTLRFFKGTNSRSRWYYLLDILLVLGFIVILETGVIISTWLDLALVNYVAWLDLHTYASFATLGLLVVKVALHWRWVTSLTGKIFGSGQAKPSLRNLAPAPVRINSNTRSVERREFLAMMGVVSLGSLLAVTNVLTENMVAKAGASPVLADTGADTASSISTNPPAPTTAADASVPAQQASSITATTTASTAVPTATQQAAAQVAACTVRCDRHCSFPGKCRRYTDQNANNLCDLGECM